MADGVVCSHCGYDLSPDGTQPCPSCGKTGRTIEVSVYERVVARDDHIMGIEQGETGRYAIHSDSKNPTDSLTIESLVQEFLSGRLAAFEAYLDRFVARFKAAAAFKGTFYRGVDSSIKGLLLENVIGPSPTPGQGRYNLAGERCIYLIDNAQFLPTELGTESILVQKYVISLSTLKIADLSPGNEIENSLSLVFQMTERGKTGSGYDFELELQKQGKSKYLLSQSTAQCFKDYGWQGLYVPGVHGKPGQLYRNLVLFGSCVDSWRDWTIGEYRTLS